MTEEPKFGQSIIAVTPEWLERLGIMQTVRDSIQEQSANTDEVMEQLKAVGVNLQCTCCTAPVQFEGEVDGLALYFRARGDRWDCAIAPTLEDAIGETNLAYYKESDYGEDYDASWMPHKEALELILGCVQEFRTGEVKGDRT